MVWHLSRTRQRRILVLKDRRAKNKIRVAEVTKVNILLTHGVPRCPKIFYPNTVAIIRRGCTSEAVDT